MRRCLILIIFILLSAVTGITGQEDDVPVSTAEPTTPISRVRLTVDNVPSLSLYAAVELPDVNRVAWSPGGFYLAAVARNIIYLYDMTDLSIPPRTLPHSAMIVDLAFHPDGNTLATSAGGEINLWDMENLSRRDNFDGDARHLVYSPDGSLLAYLNVSGNILYLLNTENRENLPVTVVEGRLTGLAFSPNGSALVGGTGSGQVQLWNSRTFLNETLGSATTGSTGSGDPEPVNGVVYTQDGQFIVSAEMTNGLSVWDARNKTPLRTLQNDGAQYFEVSVNTRVGLLAAVGGTYLPGVENRIRLWHLASGAELAAVRHPGALSAAFSPEGTMIASAGSGMIYLWAAADSLPSMAQARDWSRINVIAYCDVLEQPPGQILPFQSMSLVWSWYATTPELVQTHIDAALYTLSLNGRRLTGWRYLTKTMPDEVNENLPTVYWYMPIGGLAAGNYTVSYGVNWREAISDGLAEFGPGTAVPQDSGTCTFEVSE